MNSVNLVGRLTKDPEVRYSQGENPMAIARFTIACDRKFAKKGEQTADFINCISFGKQGELIEKFFHKGMRIGIRGRIQTGSYTNKDGNKVYTTDVVTEEVEFVDSKNANSESSDHKSAPANDDFMKIPDGISDEVPFI